MKKRITVLSFLLGWSAFAGAEVTMTFHGEKYKIIHAKIT